MKKKTSHHHPEGEKKQKSDQRRKLDTSTGTRKRLVIDKQTNKLTPGKVAKPSKVSDDVPQAPALKSSKSTRNTTVANSSSKGHSLKASKETLGTADTLWYHGNDPLAKNNQPMQPSQMADRLRHRSVSPNQAASQNPRANATRLQQPIRNEPRINSQRWCNKWRILYLLYPSQSSLRSLH